MRILPLNVDILNYTGGSFILHSRDIVLIKDYAGVIVILDACMLSPTSVCTTLVVFLVSSLFVTIPIIISIF